MIFREAYTGDIPQIQRVRHAVKENMLSDPALVTDDDCATFLTIRGKGWVCIAGDCIIGFAIADLHGHNIWALFVHPDFEGRGIGQELHKRMLDWYFLQTRETVWLSTAPGTRAMGFYKKAGWLETGMHGKNEVKFELTYTKWATVRLNSSKDHPGKI